MVNLQHFIFTPKYRLALLAKPEIAKACENHILHIAKLKGIKIVALSVQPDHAHVFCEIGRTMTVADAAGVMKWYASLYTRRQFPELKAACKSHLWGHAYFHRSVGGDQATTRRYIENQERHHKTEFRWM